MANIAQLPDPVAITKDASQGLGVSADDLRYGFGGLTTPRGNTVFGYRGGVYPGQSNGGLITDCQVMANGTMQTTVQPGNYAIPRVAHGVYFGAIISAVTVTHDASSTVNPRIDLVVIRLRDPGYDTGVTQSASIRILKGNPAAIPVEPTSLLTDGDLVLGAVTVRKSAGNIITSDIAERRIFLAGRGGIRPKSAYDNLVPAYEGEYRDNLVTNTLERGDASGRWTPMASPAEWTQFTPKLYHQGGECYLGSTGQANGFYIVSGKIMHLRYEFNGVRPMNLGYGAITTRLPSGYYSATKKESHIHCKVNLHSPPAGSTGIHIGDLFIPPNSNLMRFYFPLSHTNNSILDFRAATSQSAVGTGVPLVPGNYPDFYILTCQGTIEIQ